MIDQETIQKEKEAGHQIADWVDRRTTGFLSSKYFTLFQYDKQGKELIRSMGDIWLEYKEIYHPINVKTGVSSSKEGMPNMVSLKKVLDALLNFQIDSYYLLMIKFKVESTIESTVYFVDMLDYLQYVGFDSGPGQIMLKAKNFFTMMSSSATPEKLSMKQKVKKLFDILKDGERRLVINRRKDLDEYKKLVNVFESVANLTVTPETQKALNLRVRNSV